MAKPLSGNKLGKAALALMAFAIIAGGALWFAVTWRPDPNAYPVQGVDVSNDQGEIAWPNVEADNVDFAYVKATEGGELRDPRFAENWNGASRAGLRRGAYHDYTLCRLATDQASNFIATVPRDESALPAAISLHFENGCAEKPGRSVVLSELATFIEMVESHTGKPVILLLTHDFEEAYQVSAAIDRPLWLQRYAFPPDFGARPWVMWKANGIRMVDGISGPASWNVVRQ